MKIINVIISEPVQAMPIKFAVKINGLYDHCQSDDLDILSRLQVHLKLDCFSTCSILDNIGAISFKLNLVAWP